MPPPPPKRGKPNINIHPLPLSDLQVLERAAALLNKSLSQLLDVPAEEGPQPYIVGSTTPVPFSKSSQDSRDTGTSLANPQFWVSTSSHIRPDELHAAPPLSSSLQGRQDTTELGILSVESWQDADISHGSARNSSSRPDHSLGGAFDFQHLTMGECQIIDTEPTSGARVGSFSEPFLGGSTEINDPFTSGPETSSEDSENENNLLDAQAWENVSLPPVDQLATSAGSNGSDYIWIEESEESHAVQRRPPLDGSNGAVSQWVQSDGNSKARGSTRQKTRGPFQNLHLRTETSNTRKLKACVRCRMQKVRVIIMNSVRILLLG